MIESIYSEAFVAAVLNDATLLGATALNGAFKDKVFKNAARQGATPPFVVYNVASGSDVNTSHAVRLFTRPTFQVRVVGKVVAGSLQDASRVRAAAHRMDELLRGVRRQEMSFEDGTTRNFNAWREDELPPREEPGEAADITYRSYGGFYRVENFS